MKVSILSQFICLFLLATSTLVAATRKEPHLRHEINHNPRRLQGGANVSRLELNQPTNPLSFDAFGTREWIVEGGSATSTIVCTTTFADGGTARGKLNLTLSYGTELFQTCNSQGFITNECRVELFTDADAENVRVTVTPKKQVVEGLILTCNETSHLPLDFNTPVPVNLTGDNFRRVSYQLDARLMDNPGINCSLTGSTGDADLAVYQVNPTTDYRKQLCLSSSYSSNEHCDVQPVDLDDATHLVVVVEAFGEEPATDAQLNCAADDVNLPVTLGVPTEPTNFGVNETKTFRTFAPVDNVLIQCAFPDDRVKLEMTTETNVECFSTWYNFGGGDIANECAVQVLNQGESIDIVVSNEDVVAENVSMTCTSYPMIVLEFGVPYGPFDLGLGSVPQEPKFTLDISMLEEEDLVTCTLTTGVGHVDFDVNRIHWDGSDHFEWYSSSPDFQATTNNTETYEVEVGKDTEYLVLTALLQVIAYDGIHEDNYLTCETTGDTTPGLPEVVDLTLEEPFGPFELEEGEQKFLLEVPEGYESVTCTADGEGLDLFVRVGEEPTLEDFDCSSAGDECEVSIVTPLEIYFGEIPTAKKVYALLVSPEDKSDITITCAGVVYAEQAVSRGNPDGP